MVSIIGGGNVSGGGGLSRAAPPPRCIRRTCCAIRLRLVEFLGPCVHMFLSVRGKTSCALRFIFFVSCVHEGLGPLGSYLFWGLRFFGALGSLKIWCDRKISLNSENFWGLSEVLFFFGCLELIFWGGLRRIKVLGS